MIPACHTKVFEGDEASKEKLLKVAAVADRGPREGGRAGERGGVAEAEQGWYGTAGELAAERAGEPSL